MVKIMIVDDSLLTLRIIKNIFNDYNLINIDIVSAIDGTEAIKKYKEEKPDLVLMDITMPNLDGITALKEIINFDSNAKIIMATSINQHQTMKETIQMGALGYITKPFAKEKILEILKKHLNISI
jgi:two-component system, chemotaxis family, chemotaxis protein CheY